MSIKTNLEEMLTEVIEWENKYYKSISLELYKSLIEYECEIRKELAYEEYNS